MDVDGPGAARVAISPYVAEHEIENDEVDRLALGVGERFVTGADEMRVPPLFMKVMRDQIGDVAIVFGDENLHGAVAPLSHALSGSRTARTCDRSVRR